MLGYGEVSRQHCQNAFLNAGAYAIASWSHSFQHGDGDSHVGESEGGGGPHDEGYGAYNRLVINTSFAMP